MKLKIIDLLIILGSIPTLLLLCFIAYGSVNYWVELLHYIDRKNVYAICFHGGLALAITIGITEYIEKFVRAFAVSYQNIFVKK